MRILTVSASPFLLTSQGRLNARLLRHFSASGHEVAGVVWDHDFSYFMPDNDGKSYFEEDGKRICCLYPLVSSKDIAKQTSAAIAEFQPQIVISVGDYYEISFLSVLKDANPKLFRWIAVLTTAATPIEKKYKDALQSIDEGVVTTKAAYEEIRNMTSVPLVCRNPGINLKKFFPDGDTPSDVLRIVANIKNTQSCNPPVFIRALQFLANKGVGFEAVLHTNMYGKGDYDLKTMIDDAGLSNKVLLPTMFTSIQEGPSDDYLRRIYSSCHLVVNPSLKAGCALNVLEAMACGCVPLVTEAGALGDILAEFPNPAEHIIQSYNFIGDRHQIMKMASEDSLTGLMSWHNAELKRRGCLQKKSNSIAIAQRYSRDTFVLDVESAIGRSVGETRLSLPVEKLV